MEAKKIIKKLLISSIIGIILGIITEYALILNIKWLILITQSFIFWGLIICMMAFLSKDYIFSIANPMITITLMNITYYVIRLIKSGHTNTDGLVLFVVMGIAGSIYIGTFIYILKKIVIYHQKENYHQICYFVFMTVVEILLPATGLKNPLTYISHNLFYNISYGIISGFFIGILASKLIQKCASHFS